MWSARLIRRHFARPDRYNNYGTPQSKAWVEQARYILDAGQIAHREYEEGILPQDIELIKQYMSICKTKRDQGRGISFGHARLAKGFRRHHMSMPNAAAFQQTRSPSTMPRACSIG